jgi:hypothetical protein
MPVRFSMLRSGSHSSRQAQSCDHSPPVCLVSTIRIVLSGDPAAHAFVPQIESRAAIGKCSLALSVLESQVCQEFHLQIRRSQSWDTEHPAKLTRKPRKNLAKSSQFPNVVCIFQVYASAKHMAEGSGLWRRLSVDFVDENVFVPRLGDSLIEPS